MHGALDLPHIQYSQTDRLSDAMDTANKLQIDARAHVAKQQVPLELSSPSLPA